MGTVVGRNAEELVANLLAKKGHKIKSLNWHTRWCEIDIVSVCNKTVYFTEVKFRKNIAWGSGFDYVLKTKIKQMQLAARFWIHNNKWLNDAVLQVASVNAEDEVEFVTLDGSETM